MVPGCPAEQTEGLGGGQLLQPPQCPTSELWDDFLFLQQGWGEDTPGETWTNSSELEAPLY